MRQLNIIPAHDLASMILEKFNGEIAPDDFGFVCRTYSRPPRKAPDRFAHGKLYGYRAREPFYPASVIKVFFMVALFQRIKDKTIILDSEDERALKNMIQISSNDATTFLVNRITDTRGGIPLTEEKMAAWWKKRTWVQTYFKEFGWPEFDPIQVYHSTYEESPYGREQICRDMHGTNVLTPLAAATLMHAIAAEQIIDQNSSGQMMDLLSRDWERVPSLARPQEVDQVRGFMVEAVPEHFKVWSKAGSTSTTRHDLVYIESPDGKAMTMAAFSRGRVCAGNKKLLPFLGHKLLEQFV